MSESILAPIAYFGNIEYYSRLFSADSIVFEQHEYFNKQTFRNRASIYGANGLLKLIVPLQKISGTRQVIKDIRISYADNWQNLHWRSLESAYRRSPYFEYFENSLRPLFEKKPEFLLDLNQEVHQWICEKLDVSLSATLTETYQASPPAMTDLRSHFKPKSVSPSKIADARYLQVFEDKCGFLPNLSILDVLFNQGPAGTGYLMSLSTTTAL